MDLKSVFLWTDVHSLNSRSNRCRYIGFRLDPSKFIYDYQHQLRKIDEEISLGKP